METDAATNPPPGGGTASPFAPLLREGRLIVCGGPGGVGKTTSAAALGLRAALFDRKVIVLTIDPARRLANSLGLEELTNEPQRIALDALDAGDEGELWAMMLDQEQTFEDLVQTAAPDRRTLERSHDNEIFQLLSSALHGMQEYAALDKLHDLYTEGYFDLVVLDTPPTAGAIDFLKAPERLASFFDRRILKWFLPESSRSSGFFGSLFDPGSMVLKLLSRLVGESFVEDLVEFFDTFQYLQETLKDRGEMIEYIIRDEQTHFALITSPAPRRIREAIDFDRQLDTFDQRASAFVVNKVTPDFDNTDLDELSAGDLQGFAENRARPSLEVDDALFDQMARQYGDLARLAERDRTAIATLAEEVGDELLQLVPTFDRDIHSIEQLREMSQFLLAAENGGARSR